ncbi:MAG TPA: DUF465 domain-containing protein [Thermoanaerobaculia bacterium]|nr:DUF465 domain-containing protein [Thermoanaerobaculia bacterium]
MNQEVVRQELLAHDEEFRRLHQEHQEYESRLEAILEKASLSQEDEAETKKIKVHKLALKDRMASLVREHEASATV